MTKCQHRREKQRQEIERQDKAIERRANQFYERKHTQNREFFRK